MDDLLISLVQYLQGTFEATIVGLDEELCHNVVSQEKPMSCHMVRSIIVF